MWQPQEDNTYNDLRENSIRQWLEDMSRHEDVAVRGGVKVTAEYLEDLKKQTPTICMAISLEIPNNEHAIGISNRDPPATPDAPQAARVARILSTIPLKKST